MNEAQKNGLFEDSYYAWAKQEFTQEASRRYPLLSRIRIPATETLITMMSFRSSIEQPELMSAFLNRGHARAAKRSGMSLTDQDKALLGEYSGKLLRSSGNASADIDKKALIAEIDSKLTPFLGAPKVRIRSGLTYETAIGVLRVKTRIDWGGRGLLTYWHSVQDETVVADFISILSWLGVMSQTTWSSWSGNPESLGILLRDIVGRFLDSSLLKDYQKM